MRIFRCASPADTADGASAWALFDRNTRVGWSPPSAAPAGAAHVRVSLGKPTTITHLKIFGASPYLLDAHTDRGEPIRGLEHVRLEALGAGWNVLRLPSPSTASEIVLERRARATRCIDSGSGRRGSSCGADRPARRLDAPTIRRLAASGARSGPHHRGWTSSPRRTSTIDLAPGGDRPGVRQPPLLADQEPHLVPARVDRLTADGAFRSFV